MDCFIMMASLFKFLATSCGIWDLGSLTKDRIHNPCIGRQSLNHGATREVPLHDGVNPPFPHDLWYWASHNVLIFCIPPLAKCLCKYITHFLTRLESYTQSSLIFFFFSQFAMGIFPYLYTVKWMQHTLKKSFFHSWMFQLLSVF